MAVPGKVLNLTLTKVRKADGTPGVRLKWDHLPNTGDPEAVPPVPYYEIQRQVGLPQSILVNTIDDHDGVPLFVIYVDYPGPAGLITYSVRGVNPEGSGEFSDPSTITIAAPPAMTNVVLTQVIRADGKVGVQFAFDYIDGVTAYRFTRQDISGPVSYNLSQPGLPPSNRRLLYQDFFVTSPEDYTYTLRAVDGTLLGATSDHTVSLTAADGGVPGNGGGDTYTAGVGNPRVVRWTFRDVWGTGGTQQVYTFEINPNEGGSPEVSKNLNIATNVGPNRGAILQEGQNTAPVLNFSGVIITQSHYEALETWFDKKILLELKDDLGRTFRGVFSGFTPSRQRRPYNPWFHNYTAQFTCFGYKNASGQIRYGRF